MITEITSPAQFHQIIGQDAISIVDYHAPWCGPSKAILPTFAHLSELYNRINFYKIDVDEQAQLTQEAGARVYPTFIIYRGGAKTLTDGIPKVQTISGANPDGLTTLIKSVVRQA